MNFETTCGMSYNYGINHKPIKRHGHVDWKYFQEGIRDDVFFFFLIRKMGNFV